MIGGWEVSPLRILRHQLEGRETGSGEIAKYGPQPGARCSRSGNSSHTQQMPAARFRQNRLRTLTRDSFTDLIGGKSRLKNIAATRREARLILVLQCVALCRHLQERGGRFLVCLRYAQGRQKVRRVNTCAEHRAKGDLPTADGFQGGCRS